MPHRYLKATVLLYSWGEHCVWFSTRLRYTILIFIVSNYLFKSDVKLFLYLFICFRSLDLWLYHAVSLSPIKNIHKFEPNYECFLLMYELPPLNTSMLIIFIQCRPGYTWKSMSSRRMHFSGYICPCFCRTPTSSMAQH